MDHPQQELWTEEVCMGYMIMALENLDYREQKIWEVIAELKELFDWVSTADAKEHYGGGRY